MAFSRLVADATSEYLTVLLACPTGNPRIPLMRKLPVEPVCRMLAGLHRRANQADLLGHPVRDEEGRFGRSSRSVASGERWTHRGLGFAFAGRRTTSVRTVKSRGPDTPTLVSPAQRALRVVAVRWPTSPAHRGDREAAVKTAARGRPGPSGWTCGTCRLHFFSQAGHGPQSRSGLPCALSFVEGDVGSMTWARSAPRERCPLFGKSFSGCSGERSDALARAAACIGMRWNGRTTSSVSSRA